MARSSHIRDAFRRTGRAKLPLPLLSWILICTGVAFGGLVLPTAHALGSAPMKWLGLAAMIGGPVAGVALFVYHLRTVREH